jgi:hypothetical protein
MRPNSLSVPTPKTNPFLSLPLSPCSPVVHCGVRLQAHCSPVACRCMRLQAPSIMAKCPISVHTILTLVCLCRALRLTRPTRRLPRPSHRLPCSSLHAVEVSNLLMCFLSCPFARPRRTRIFFWLSTFKLCIIILHNLA